MSVRKRVELRRVYTYILRLLLNWTDIAVLFVAICYEMYTVVSLFLSLKCKATSFVQIANANTLYKLIVLPAIRYCKSYTTNCIQFD